MDRPVKIYYGWRVGPNPDTASDTIVQTIEDIDGQVRPLPTALEVVNHSPDGFSWGYTGSGPAQLALAILVNHMGSEEATANGLYQRFKDRFVAHWGNAWSITSLEIDDWLENVVHAKTETIYRVTANDSGKHFG